MERRIIGFHQDDAQHWVAELECGHHQHVRHHPPWSHRLWVITAEGRANAIGRVLACVKCDAGAPPDRRIDEPIADAGRGGRSVRIVQDVNGHFYVERDGVPAEEAVHRGARSDALMRAEGYRPVVEVYPELHERPPVPAGVELDELYVSVRPPPG